MSKRWTVVAALLALAAAAPALAQDAPPAPGTAFGAPPGGTGGGPAPRDPLAEWAPPGVPAPAPAPATRPDDPWRLPGDAVPVPGPAPAPAARAGGPAPVTPVGATGGADAFERDEAATREIGRNLDDTIAIYEKILSEQRESTRVDAKRVESNREIIAKYAPELAKFEDEFRKLQVTYMNRTLALKRQREEGKITEATYQKQLGEEYGKYERARQRLTEELAFYREEVGGAEMRAAEFERRRSEKEARLRVERPDLFEKKRTPAEKAIEGMQSTLQRLSGFETRNTMDSNVLCAHCNRFLPEAVVESAGHEGAPPRK